MRAAIERSIDSPGDTLEEIGRAIAAALEREGGPVAVLGTLLVLLALVVALVRWVRREQRREAAEREALEARRAALLSATTATNEQRQWVRIPAQLDVKVRHASGTNRFINLACKTRDISGSGVAFLSSRPPPPGQPVQFTLDLKEKAPLPLRGTVVRVDPPPAPGAPSLVAVKLGPITPADREHVVRWVTRQSSRSMARVRPERLCPRCGRALADDAGDTHPTCVAVRVKRTPRAV
jgi:hypothetical protein